MNLVFRTMGGLCILTLMWIALTEQWTWPNVLLGLFLSASAWLSIHFLHRGQTVMRWSWNHAFHWIRFFVYLLGQIYLSGVQTLVHIFQGKFHVSIVEVQTQLHDAFLISVLAASITLTPGTVTINRRGSILEVLWLHYGSVDETAEIRIKKKIEILLLHHEQPHQQIDGKE